MAKLLSHTFCVSLLQVVTNKRLLHLVKSPRVFQRLVTHVCGCTTLFCICLFSLLSTVWFQLFPLTAAFTPDTGSSSSSSGRLKVGGAYIDSGELTSGWAAGEGNHWGTAGEENGADCWDCGICNDRRGCEIRGTIVINKIIIQRVFSQSSDLELERQTMRGREYISLKWWNINVSVFFFTFLII